MNKKRFFVQQQEQNTEGKGWFEGFLCLPGSQVRLGVDQDHRHGRFVAHYPAGVSIGEHVELDHV